MQEIQSGKVSSGTKKILYFLLKWLDPDEDQHM